MMVMESLTNPSEPLSTSFVPPSHSLQKSQSYSAAGRRGGYRRVLATADDTPWMLCEEFREHGSFAGCSVKNSVCCPIAKLL